MEIVFHGHIFMGFYGQSLKYNNPCNCCKEPPDGGYPKIGLSSEIRLYPIIIMGLMVLLQYNQHLPVTIALYARIETPS